MISRTLQPILHKKLGSGRAIVLVGARQVGKTSLLKEILRSKDYLFLDGDDPSTRRLLTEPNTEQIRSLLGKHTIVFLDEAQRIPNVGLTLKIITDQFKEVQLLVSGSSSFDLGNALNEPLTGRKWEYELFPITWEEYESDIGFLKAEQQLENRLLYGFYPEVLNHQGSEREILLELVNSYLYRDILAFSEIRKPAVLERLLQALALQMGQEVNYNELSKILGIHKVTVQNYVDILEKGYVVFRLPGFHRNLRNEIKQNRKIFFYDNGIRNMILSNFSSLDLRADKGALWENFLMAERRKQNRYKNPFAKMYFWRTRQQQEIDYVEEQDGRITAFEFKWKAQKVKIPAKFVEAYQAEKKVVHRDNFREFVGNGKG